MRRQKILLGIAAGGMVAGLAVTQGTAALWQDSGSVPDTSARTGAIGLTVNDSGSGYQWTSMTASNMRPGTSVGPQTLVLRNAGNVAMQYRLADFEPPTGLPLSYTATRVGGGDITAWRHLDPGAYETWNVTITLPGDAPDSAQGKSGRAVLTFEGRQAKHVD